MMIRLLKPGYKNNEEIYKFFLSGDLINSDKFFSEETINLKEAPDFPIYMGKGDEDQKRKDFLEAFQIISKYYLQTEREVHLNEIFWHSLLLGYKRDFILNKYPQVKKSRNDFRNIIIKDFDWENYIYKCVLGAQYINDNFEKEIDREKYYNLVINNLDIYNYIIKYEIFRNDKFLLNILTIIDQHNLSDILKAKIKNRPDLGKDERVGRRIIFEFNKAYPVLLSPMMNKDELEVPFFKYLDMYYENPVEEVQEKKKGIFSFLNLNRTYN